MCDPVTLGLLQFGIGAASTVANYSAQQQEAEATKAAAEQAFQNEQSQINLRQMQEQDALRQKQQAQNIEEAEVKASAQVSAAEGGIAGVSVDNILSDVSRRAARNREVEATNTKNIITQLQAEKKASGSRAQSRINSAPKPSPLSLVAGIGGAAIGGYGTYDKYRMA